MMKLTASVNPETGQLGTVYVQFSETPVAKTVPVKNASDPEALVDLDKDDRVVGIEILAMSILRKICGAISKPLPRKYASQVEGLCEAR